MIINISITLNDDATSEDVSSAIRSAAIEAGRFLCSHLIPQIDQQINLPISHVKVNDVLFFRSE